MSKLSLYELNKNIMENVPEEAIPTEEQLKEIINKFTTNDNSNYYMLLSNELRYYTIFEKVIQGDSQKLDLNNISTEVILCLQDLGDIIGIAEEPGALEFWVKTESGAECLYFFNYSAGIVYFTEGE